jgi:hypothetical protein
MLNYYCWYLGTRLECLFVWKSLLMQYFIENHKPPWEQGLIRAARWSCPRVASPHPDPQGQHSAPNNRLIPEISPYLWYGSAYHSKGEKLRHPWQMLTKSDLQNHNGASSNSTTVRRRSSGFTRISAQLRRSRTSACRSSSAWSL